MKFWNIPVDDNLDQQAFEAAHDLRMSKANFIRQAVKDKLPIHPRVTFIAQKKQKPMIAKVTLKNG